MANDGTVKIGAEIDEKEFKSGLSKVSKAAQSAFNNLSGSFFSISRNAETGFSAVKKGLEKTKTTISTTEKKLKELEKALKLDPQNVELLDQKQRLLAQSAEATAEKYERLKEVVESSTVSNVAFAKWEKAQAPLQEQISKTTSELENLERKAKELEGLGFSPDSSSMIEVQQRAEAAQEKLAGLQKSLSDTYDEMGRPIREPLIKLPVGEGNVVE